MKHEVTISIALDDEGNIEVSKDIKDSTGRSVKPSDMDEFQALPTSAQFGIQLAVLGTEAIEEQLDLNQKYNDKMASMLADGYSKEEAIAAVQEELGDGYAIKDASTGEIETPKPTILH